MQKNTLKPVRLQEEGTLKTLVENRTAYTLERCELNVFQTSQVSERVPLTFPDFVVTSMLRGKKVMHLYDDPGFDYLPGETVLVPAGVTMRIDFPEAHLERPTQCIALAIDHFKIQQTLDLLNERYPRAGEHSYWRISRNDHHFENSPRISGIMNHIIDVCSGDDPHKDVLADLSLQELIVNIVQVQQRKALEDPARSETTTNPLSFITAWIKANIHEDIRLSALSEKACMSQATFYRSFKREFGISPMEYIISEKIKTAKALLAERNMSVKNAAFESGFQDVNYFVRLFRKTEGITPRQYQEVLRRGSV